MKKKDQLLRPSSLQELIVVNMLNRGMVTSQMFEKMFSGIEHYPEVRKILQNQTFIEEEKQFGFDEIGLNLTKPKGKTKKNGLAQKKNKV
tara:strand:+ start:190 stop:459 length:270 start_codon:yes stop_codon:yes gene_type:complete